MDNALVLTFVKVNDVKLDANGLPKTTKSIAFRGEKVIVTNDDLGVQSEATKFYYVSVLASTDAVAITAKFTNADGTPKQHTFEPAKYEESALSATASMLNFKA